MNHDSLHPSAPAGFADSVHGSQSMFRLLLAAMARPGTIHAFAGIEIGETPVPPCVAAVLLTLVDHETSVWLDPRLPRRDEVIAWLKFTTATRTAEDPALSGFALVAEAATMPPLASFAQGSPEYPDRSTTVIVPVAALHDVAPASASSRDGAVVLAGPGIVGTIGLATTPAVPRLAAELSANRARFPRGVDLVFCAPAAIAAIPRSSRVAEAVEGGR